MSPRRSVLHRVRRGHRIAAAMLLNTVVASLLVYGAAALFFRIKDRQTPAVDLYGTIADERMHELYPRQSREEVARLWGDLIVPFKYEPFTEFQERARTSPFVNVDAAGFRRIADQGPWPPDPRRTNVFVFGGSTTFGYGVADDDTVPSRLQPLLQGRNADVRVYNFGRGYYYSTQERILFEQLLAAGHVPAVAVFIDGLNDFCFEGDDTVVSERFAALLETGSRVSFVEWLNGTAIGRAVGLLQHAGDQTAADAARNAPPKEEVYRRVIARYLENKRLIEAASSVHGVTPIFVWQPVPMYHYDLRYHLFASRGFGITARVTHGYELMAETVRAHPLDGRFLWLADVQETLHDPLYVDMVHYAPGFAERIAAHIDDRVGDAIVEARRGG